MIVTISAGSRPRPVGGVTTRYEYANGLRRLGHDVHLVHASWFGPTVTSLDEIDWFSFEPGIQHHFVRPGSSFEFPLADVISEPALGLPHEFGLPFRFVQGTSLRGGGGGEQLAATVCPTVCIARWLLDDCREQGVPEHVLFHIPNGVDHGKYRLTRPLDDRPLRVSMLHHPGPIKGADDGLTALESVHDQVPDAEVVLFGRTRPERPLPGWVTFLEHPAQEVIVDEVYNGARVFLCPSRWGEGFGKTLLEAMACGAALVTTDNGGSRDFAEHDETALVSPPRDPDALARHVVELLRDDDRRRTLARRGHDRAQAFSWEASSRALGRVLEDYVADPEPLLSA